MEHTNTPEELDDIHRQLTEWQSGADQTLDGANLPDAGGDDAMTPDAASLRRGMAMSRGQTPAPVMGNKQLGQEEPPASMPGGSPSTPRGAMMAATMGAARPSTRPPTPPPMPPSSLGYNSPAPAQKDTELEGLQQKAASDRRMGEFGKSVTAFQERPTNMLDAIQQLGGVHPSARQHNSMWDNAGAEGEQAIKDLHARRESEAGMKSAAEENDPNSETAKLYRSVLLKFNPDMAEQLKNATPKQIRQIQPWVEKFGKDNADILRSRMAAEEKAKVESERKILHGQERKENQANSDRNHQDALDGQKATRDMTAAGLGLHRNADARAAEAAARAAGKDEREQAKEAKGKPLTDSTITDLADTDSAIRSLEGLEQKFKDLHQEGIAAKLSGKVSSALGLTSTDAGQYQAAAKLSMQGVGKIMEGGKLAAGDEIKYMGMLPVPGDTYESAGEKIRAATAYLRGLRDDRVTALRRSGRDVPEFGNQPKPQKQDGAEHKTLPNGKHASKKPGGQWEVDD